MNPHARHIARQLDIELLDRLRAFGRPVSLPELFEQSWCPRWAQEAADRLVISGQLTEHPDGRLEPTRRAA
jgi:hypothetical protein